MKYPYIHLTNFFYMRFLDASCTVKEIFPSMLEVSGNDYIRGYTKMNVYFFVKIFYSYKGFKYFII